MESHKNNVPVDLHRAAKQKQYFVICEASLRGRSSRQITQFFILPFSMEILHSEKSPLFYAFGWSEFVKAFMRVISNNG